MILIIILSIVIVLLVIYFTGESFDLNYNHDRICRLIQPGQSYEDYYRYENLIETPIDGIKEIENDPTRGLKVSSYNVYPKLFSDYPFIVELRG